MMLSTMSRSMGALVVLCSFGFASGFSGLFGGPPPPPKWYTDDQKHHSDTKECYDGGRSECNIGSTDRFGNNNDGCKIGQQCVNSQSWDSTPCKIRYTYKSIWNSRTLQYGAIGPRSYCDYCTCGDPSPKWMINIEKSVSGLFKQACSVLKTIRKVEHEITTCALAFGSGGINLKADIDCACGAVKAIHGVGQHMSNADLSRAVNGICGAVSQVESALGKEKRGETQAKELLNCAAGDVAPCLEDVAKWGANKFFGCSVVH